MFVRVKKIKGKEYGYLVENQWQNSTAKQTVKEYLGRIHRQERVSEPEISIEEGQEFSEAVKAIVIDELKSYGFTSYHGSRHEYVKDELIVDLKEGKVYRKGKSVLLGIKQGHLCNHTLKQLLEFKPSERKDKTIYQLANSLVQAGIDVPQELFVALFEKLPKQEEPAPQIIAY